MFDFSFAELATIGVVALVVIGPERLPKVARTVGHLMGRAQRYVNDVKADIQREVELEDFRKLKDSVTDAAGELRTSLQDTEHTIRNAGQSLHAEIDDAIAETKKRIVDPNAHLAETAAPAAALPEPALPEPTGREALMHEAAPAATAAPAAPAPQAQAELPLADATPEAPAKPPANATTGTPT